MKEPMTNIEYRSVDELNLLENNPRTIKKADFEKLKESIEKNKEFFEARPIILSNRTGKLVVLGGNQRLRASRELGLKEVPTVLLEGLTEQQEREIVIRDNVSNGDWDMDILANEWEVEDLEEWGAPNIGFAEEIIEKASENTDDWLTGEDYDLKSLFRERVNSRIESDIKKGVDKGEIRPEIAEILRSRALQCAVFNFDEIIKFYRSGDASEVEKDLLRRLYLVFITPKEAFENGLLSLNETASRLVDEELMESRR